MKLASLVVLLVVYRTLQTDVVWPVPTPRYSWPNIAKHDISCLFAKHGPQCERYDDLNL